MITDAQRVVDVKSKPDAVGTGVFVAVVVGVDVTGDQATGFRFDVQRRSTYTGARLKRGLDLDCRKVGDQEHLTFKSAALYNVIGVHIG
ncbi:hypothetical protein D3C85_1613090 [compost metagenome]